MSDQAIEALLEILRPRELAVSAQLRKALEARDRHCRWPGCTRPGSWCEAHHVVPWIRAGATNQANLLLLCPATTCRSTRAAGSSWSTPKVTSR
jgi:hypothetical protein